MMLTYFLVVTLIAIERYGCCPNDQHCQDDICNNRTGYCLNGCQEDWNGPRCNTQNICNRCKWGHCDEERTCISGCKTGYYGLTCNKTCYHCSGNKCEHRTGACVRGCKVGWFGPSCSRRCGSGCVYQRCKSLGTCSCTRGWYGRRCDRKCEGCMDNLCHSVTGHCSRGCITGWTGVTCSTNMCRTCINNTCVAKEISFMCLFGCVSGYWGPKCDLKCPVNCTSCTVNSGSCLKCKNKPDDPTCNDLTQTNNVPVSPQTTQETERTVTNDEMTIATEKNEHKVNHSEDRKPITSADNNLNASTRMYIFIWMSLFAVFITLLLVWYAYRTWRKHKMQRRDLDNGLEMRSPIFLAADHGEHLEFIRPENRQPFADSGLYMELGDPPDGARETRNRNHAVGSIYSGLEQPQPHLLHKYTYL